MKSLLRVVACLSLCVSLNVSAGYKIVNWAGQLEEVVVLNTNQPIGEYYSGSFAYDDDIKTVSDQPESNGAWYDFQSAESTLNDLSNNRQLTSQYAGIGSYNGWTCGQPSNESFDTLWGCDTYSNIYGSVLENDTQIDSWWLESYFYEPGNQASLVSAIDFSSADISLLSGTSYLSAPPFEITNSNPNLASVFWIYEADWNSTPTNLIYGGWGYLDEFTISEVPLPAGIYLFLSGLLSLGVARLRKN